MDNQTYEVSCPACAKDFDAEPTAKEAKCPHCQARVELVNPLLHEEPKAKPAKPSKDAAPKEKGSARANFLKRPGRLHGSSIPVLDLEGVGPKYEAILAKEGITESEQLLDQDLDALAEATGVSRVRLQAWQDMSELLTLKGIGPQYAEVLVRSKVNSVKELALEDPAPLSARIQEYLDSLDQTVVGVKITEKRVASWVNEARKHAPGPTIVEVPKRKTRKHPVVEDVKKRGKAPRSGKPLHEHEEDLSFLAKFRKQREEAEFHAQLEEVDPHAKEERFHRKESLRQQREGEKEAARLAKEKEAAERAKAREELKAAKAKEAEARRKEKEAAKLAALEARAEAKRLAEEEKVKNQPSEEELAKRQAEKEAEAERKRKEREEAKAAKLAAKAKAAEEKAAAKEAKEQEREDLFSRLEDGQEIIDCPICETMLVSSASDVKITCTKCQSVLKLVDQTSAAKQVRKQEAKESGAESAEARKQAKEEAAAKRQQEAEARKEAKALKAQRRAEEREAAKAKAAEEKAQRLQAQEDAAKERQAHRQTKDEGKASAEKPLSRRDQKAVDTWVNDFGLESATAQSLVRAGIRSPKDVLGKDVETLRKQMEAA